MLKMFTGEQKFLKVVPLIAGVILVLQMALCFAANPVKVDDNDQSLKYTGSWKTTKDSMALGGTMHVSGTEGDSVELTASMTGFNIFVMKGDHAGTMDIYIDDKVESTEDSYLLNDKYQSIFRKDGLQPGKHTIKVVVNGVAGSAGGQAAAQSLDCKVYLDYIEITPAP